HPAHGAARGAGERRRAPLGERQSTERQGVLAAARGQGASGAALHRGGPELQEGEFGAGDPAREVAPGGGSRLQTCFGGVELGGRAARGRRSVKVVPTPS